MFYDVVIANIICAMSNSNIAKATWTGIKWGTTLLIFGYLGSVGMSIYYTFKAALMSTIP